MERAEEPRRVSERELVGLLEKVLTANLAGRVEREPRIIAGMIPDLLVHGEPPQLIEVINISPQTRFRLFEAVDRIRRLGEEYRSTTGSTPKLALFTPGILSVDNIKLFNSSDIAVYGKAWLFDKARSAGLLDEASALLGPDEGVLVEPPFVGRLKDIMPGQSDWRQYQKLCLEILDHLFSPPLNRGLWENENASRVNQAICSCSSSGS